MRLPVDATVVVVVIVAFVVRVTVAVMVRVMVVVVIVVFVVRGTVAVVVGVMVVVVDDFRASRLCGGGGRPRGLPFAGGEVVSRGRTLRTGMRARVFVFVFVVMFVVMVVLVRVGRRVRVQALLHLQQVEVGDVVVAQVLVLQAHHPHLAQPQAQQKVLEAAEVQPVALAVAAEQLLDVEALLALGVAGRRRVPAVLVPVLAARAVAAGVPVAVVPVAVAVAALLEQERDHAQDAEAGVHVDLHGLLAASRHLRDKEGVGEGG